MPLSDLHHVALKTQDLAASEQFYTEVLGMEKVDRPDFDFPGAWLQMGQTMFHLMAGYAAKARTERLTAAAGPSITWRSRRRVLMRCAKYLRTQASVTRKTTYGISVSGNCS